MNMASPVTFAGNNPAVKRTKAFRKAEALRLKEAQKAQYALPAQPVKKPSRKERIAAYRAEKAQAVREQAAKYQASLERYLTDPTPMNDLLKRPVYTDQEGDFTIQDLMDVMVAEEKKQQRANVLVCAVGTAMVLPVVLVYVSNFLSHGHENIFKTTGSEIASLINRFAPSVQKNVSEILKPMEEMGLIAINSDPFGHYYRFTDLGRRLLKQPSENSK